MVCIAIYPVKMVGGESSCPLRPKYCKTEDLCTYFADLVLPIARGHQGKQLRLTSRYFK